MALRSLFLKSLALKLLALSLLALILFETNALAITIKINEPSLQDYVLDQYDLISKRLHGNPHSNIQITLVATKEWQTAYNRTHCQPNQIVIKVPKEEFKDVLRHELTHSILCDKFNGRIALWADEGLSDYFERTRRLPFKPLSIDKLTSLVDYPAGKDAKLDFYCQSSNLVSKLIESKGLDTFLDAISFASRYGWQKSFNHFYPEAPDVRHPSLR